MRFDRRGRAMNQRGLLWGMTLFVAAALLGGCHTDPNVRKQKYFESGKRYSAEGKYREAAIQFSNALKMAQPYVRLVQYAPAHSELMRTVDLQPTNYKARLDLGNLLLAARRTDDAAQQANIVLAAEPNPPDVHALLSAIDLRRGLKDEALAEIQKALELEPSRAAFHEDLALLEVGDPSKATSTEDELKESIKLDPKSVNAKLLLAAFYMRNGRWHEAEQMSTDAIST